MSGFAGMCALFVGAGLCVAGWLASNSPAGAWLARGGIALLVLSLPLFVFGAHCFDCVDGQERATRRASHQHRA